MILIEPALRETSRDLLAVRDRLIAGGIAVIAPCFWTGPCPALANERDWCHDTAAGQAGARVDFSYLVLRDRTGAPETAPDLFRVVSEPLVEKGRLRLYGCGPAGRHPLIRLDRSASAANTPFAEARRGDVLRVGSVETAGDGLRVTPASSVTRRPGGQTAG